MKIGVLGALRVSDMHDDLGSREVRAYRTCSFGFLILKKHFIFVYMFECSDCMYVGAPM